MIFWGLACCRYKVRQVTLFTTIKISVNPAQIKVGEVSVIKHYHPGIFLSVVNEIFQKMINLLRTLKNLVFFLIFKNGLRSSHYTVDRLRVVAEEIARTFNISGARIRFCNPTYPRYTYRTPTANKLTFECDSFPFSGSFSSPKAHPIKETSSTFHPDTTLSCTSPNICYLK